MTPSPVRGSKSDSHGPPLPPSVIAQAMPSSGVPNGSGCNVPAQ
jgi:hypothetical protein